MPSWWMPLSWAKALAPTIALFACTAMPVMPLTMRLARVISVATTPVENGMTSRRTWSAMAISSTAALPARSPMPLTVASTCRAPAITAASVLATARPRSLWQCVENSASGAFGTRPITSRNIAPYVSGVA